MVNNRKLECKKNGMKVIVLKKLLALKIKGFKK
jgi:hypothetical protein